MKMFMYVILYLLAFLSAQRAFPAANQLKTSTQAGTASLTTETIELPNNQATSLGRNKVLYETGSKNRVVNPNFEHSTTASGWTCDASAIATVSEDTLTPIEGKKSMTFSCSGSLGAASCLCYQDVPTLHRLQGMVSMVMKASSTTGVKLYSRVNGANSQSINVSNLIETPYEIPTVMGTTSTGIAFEIVVANGETKSVTVDEAFVGRQEVKSEKIRTQSSFRNQSATFTNAIVTGALSETDGGSGLYSYNSTTGVYTVLSRASFNIVASMAATGASFQTIIRVNSGAGYTDVGVSNNVSSGWGTTSYTGTLKAGDTFYVYAASGTNLQKITVAATSVESTISVTNTDFGWTPIACSGSWTTNTTYACKYKRRGEMVDVQATLTLTGAPNAIQLYINPLNGMAIDNAKLNLPVNGYNSLWSGGYFSDASASNLGIHAKALYFTGAGVIYVGYHNGTVSGYSGTYQNQPIVFASGDTVQISYSYPVVGWDNTNTITASLGESVTTPGVVKPVVFSFDYGAAAGQRCVTSPCPYLDQIGNTVIRVERIGTGSYRAVLNQTFSKVKCVMLDHANNVSYTLNAGPISCTNCTLLGWASVNTAAVAQPVDTFGGLICHGVLP